MIYLFQDGVSDKWEGFLFFEDAKDIWGEMHSGMGGDFSRILREDCGLRSWVKTGNAILEGNYSKLQWLLTRLVAMVTTGGK